MTGYKDHVPVLVNEVINHIHVSKNKNYIDATVDGGALAQTILERNAPHGMLLGFEWDEQLWKTATQRLEIFKDRCAVVHSNYVNMKSVVAERKFGPVAGIIFDLGVSSYHFESSGRGFSFQRDEPLDMRFNPGEQFETASDIINSYSCEDLEKILRHYGEERNADVIAASIVSERARRPIKTTKQLTELVERAYRMRKGASNPSTKTFQALRIAVNRELENIADALPQALSTVEKGGYLAVISFHSLEDRIVKKFFNTQKTNHIIVTKKPIVPEKKERALNPRSRSAKLRILQKNNL